MALDLMGEITAVDLMVIASRGRRAMDETVAKWEAYSAKLDRELKIEKCFNAANKARFNLLEKLIAEGRQAEGVRLTKVMSKDNKPLPLTHLAFKEAFLKRAEQLGIDGAEICPI